MFFASPSAKVNHLLFVLPRFRQQALNQLVVLWAKVAMHLLLRFHLALVIVIVVEVCDLVLVVQSNWFAVFVNEV